MQHYNYQPRQFVPYEYGRNNSNAIQSDESSHIPSGKQALHTTGQNGVQMNQHPASTTHLTYQGQSVSQVSHMKTMSGSSFPIQQNYPRQVSDNITGGNSAQMQQPIIYHQSVQALKDDNNTIPRHSSCPNGMAAVTTTTAYNCAGSNLNISPAQLTESGNASHPNVSATSYSRYPTITARSNSEQQPSQWTSTSSVVTPSHGPRAPPIVAWPPWNAARVNTSSNNSVAMPNALPPSGPPTSVPTAQVAVSPMNCHVPTNSYPPRPPLLPTSYSVQGSLSTFPSSTTNHAPASLLNGTNGTHNSLPVLTQDLNQKLSIQTTSQQALSKPTISHPTYQFPPLSATQTTRPTPLPIPEHTRVVNLMRIPDPLGDENTIYGGKIGPLEVDYPLPILSDGFSEKINCSPTVLASTLNALPTTSQILQESRLPFGLALHPFRDLSNLSVIQTSTIVRCKQCRTYIHPFVTLLERSSRRWRCSVCFRANELPDEFFYDPVTKRFGDPQRRPELKCATVEYIAPGEYALRSPQPSLYFFLFEVTRSAVMSGYLHLICRIISQNFKSMPGDDRTLVGFMTYGDGVDFFQLNGTSPSHFSCTDLEEIYFPIPSSNLVARRSSHHINIVDLLETLPNLYYNSRQSGNCLGFALKAALQIIGSVGGRITVFNHTLPNRSFGALKERQISLQQSGKADALLEPATDFYKNFALDCAGSQVAVDIFSLGSDYQDLSTISDMCRVTGGSLYRYGNIKYHGGSNTNQQVDSLGELDRSRLRHDFTRYLTRKIGFEAVLRLRCTKGINIVGFYGNGFVRSTDLMSLPNVNPDSGYVIQLSLTESLSTVTHVTLQSALLYTSSQGERRIRVHTLCLPVTHDHSVIYQHANHYAIATLLGKMSAERVFNASSTGNSSLLSTTREALVHALVDPLQFYSKQQHRSASLEQLSVSYHLRHLARFILALLKYPPLLPAEHSNAVGNVDDRVYGLEILRNYPLTRILPLIYPIIWDVHQIPMRLPSQTQLNENSKENSQGSQKHTEQPSSDGLDRLSNNQQTYSDSNGTEEDEDEDYDDEDTSPEGSSSSSKLDKIENPPHHSHTSSTTNDGSTTSSQPQEIVTSSISRLDGEIDKWLVKGHHGDLIGPKTCIRQLPASTAFLSRDGAYLLDLGEYLLLLLCRELSMKYLNQLFTHSNVNDDGAIVLPPRWNTSPLLTQMDDHLIPRTTEPVNCYFRSVLRYLHTNRRMGTVLCAMRDVSPLRSFLVMQRLVEDRWSAAGTSTSATSPRNLSVNNIQMEAASCSYIEFLQMIAQAVQNMR